MSQENSDSTSAAPHISRRDFLKLATGAALSPFYRGLNKIIVENTSNSPVELRRKPTPLTLIEHYLDNDFHLQTEVDTIKRTESPLLWRVVDSAHPITEDEIKTQILPHLILAPADIPFKAQDTRINALCLDNLIALFRDAQITDPTVTIKSAFRDYFGQRIVFKKYEEGYALPPGASQHHTGLAIDLTCAATFYDTRTDAHFEKTPLSTWLGENAHTYGYLLSYANQHDGIVYEPWHYVYVGPRIASFHQNLHEQGWEGDVFDVQRYLTRRYAEDNKR